MKREHLLNTLRQLHAELSHIDEVDPETLEQFDQVTRQVKEALDERDRPFSESAEPVTGLRALLLKYEAEHPQTAAAIGRVADALAAMGI